MLSLNNGSVVGVAIWFVRFGTDCAVVLFVGVRVKYVIMDLLTDVFDVLIIVTNDFVEDAALRSVINMFDVDAVGVVYDTEHNGKDVVGIIGVCFFDDDFINNVKREFVGVDFDVVCIVFMVDKEVDEDKVGLAVVDDVDAIFELMEDVWDTPNAVVEVNIAFKEV